MSYFSSAADYLASTPSYLYSNITYYTQTFSQVSPLEALGQSIEKTFGNIHTSKITGRETVSEISILADVVAEVRKSGAIDSIGLLQQIENAKLIYVKQHEESMKQLSKSQSLTVFREQQETRWVAIESAFNKLFLFIHQNLLLLATVKSLNKSQVLSQQNFSQDMSKAIDELVQLDLDRIKREETNSIIEDFELVEKSMSMLHVTPPMESSVSTSSFSSASETEQKENISVLKSADDLESLVIDEYLNKFATAIHFKSPTMRMVDHLTDQL